jgi:hypothetical protein
MTSSFPWNVPTNPPDAFASATALTAAMLSSRVSGCVFGATRSWKIRGELTIFAWSGWASGTLITSILNCAVLGSFGEITQPASSDGERTGACPEM